MTTDPIDVLEEYLLDPSAEKLAALRSAVLSAPGFDPHGSVAELAARCREEYPGDPERCAEEMLRSIGAGMPGLLLSLSAHAHLARALDVLGQREQAARERQMAATSLELMRADGDGSESAPFAALRIEDEYDLVAASRRQSRSQRLVERNDEFFDVHELTDGAELWFRLLWRSRGGA